MTLRRDNGTKTGTRGSQSSPVVGLCEADCVGQSRLGLTEPDDKNSNETCRSCYQNEMSESKDQDHFSANLIRFNMSDYAYRTFKAPLSVTHPSH